MIPLIDVKNGDISIPLVKGPRQEPVYYIYTNDLEIFISAYVCLSVCYQVFCQ